MVREVSQSPRSDYRRDVSILLLSRYTGVHYTEALEVALRSRGLAKVGKAGALNFPCIFSYFPLSVPVDLPELKRYVVHFVSTDSRVLLITGPYTGRLKRVEPKRSLFV